jgi:hypothetical protein
MSDQEIQSGLIPGPATIRQPLPTVSPNSQRVIDYIVNSRLSSGLPEQLLADLDERVQLGLTKYRTYLLTFNGRNAKIDLYQELLDSIFYAAQMEAEEGYARFILDTLINLAGLVRSQIG